MLETPAARDERYDVQLRELSIPFLSREKGGLRRNHRLDQA
jgi:hypothetical protein